MPTITKTLYVFEENRINRTGKLLYYDPLLFSDIYTTSLSALSVMNDTLSETDDADNTFPSGVNAHLFDLSAPTGSFVSYPTGWIRTDLPFSIRQSGSSFRTDPGWDIDTDAPMDGTIYYVSTTGNDANPGTSSASPLRGIDTALAKSGNLVIYVEAGTYDFSNSWGTTVVSGKNVSLIATGGRVVISPRYAGLSWTNQGPTYANTYLTVRSNTGWLFDALNLDANGNYSRLNLQTSIADVDANPGSFYIVSGSYVYARLSDDRAPDSDCLVMIGTISNVLHSFRGPNTLYVKNCDFEGAYGSAADIRYSSGAPTAYYDNCTFKYAAMSDGFVSLGARTYMKNCISEANYDDGFNYHSSTISCSAVEINCISRFNGSALNIDNGSTMHDDGNIVRMNGDYHHNVGRNIHDVNVGTQSWNLGVYSHDSSGSVSTTNVNFAVGTGSTGGSMWLDSCLSRNSTYDLEENTNAVLYYRDLISGGSFIGTPTTY